jgi:type VI secretion system protein VasD
MTYTRRTVILTGASALALAACGAAGGTINVAASMAAGANPGSDGADRPLTLTLVQLKATDAFDGTDVLALQDPASSLGADLLGTEQIVLAPGGSTAIAIPIMPGATALGIVAGFRNPSGKTVRTTISLPSAGTVPVNISVSAAGLSLA